MRSSNSFLAATTLVAALLISSIAWAGPLETLDRGDVETARGEVARTDDAESLVVRATLALRDGKFDDAETRAKDAIRSANSEALRGRATVVLAQIHSARGDQEHAEKLLRSVLSGDPKALHARLELGRLLVESGRNQEAELVLDTFSRFYNNGILKSSTQLALLGEAMWLLGSFQDASHAFQEAIDIDSKNVRARVAWGLLLLDKYNTADAEKTLKEALGLTPNQPDALVALAKTELLLTNDYNTIRNLLDRASLLEPDHPEMHVVYARVAIYDSDCPTARDHAASVLKVRPEYLSALTIVAACDYLDDNLKAFEASKQKAFAINPTYAELLADTGEYAVREHRYVEAVTLYREALKLRPDFPQALLGLGIGLSRIGEEDEALDVLRRAFDADPYNVRAFNMVELYEKVMPEYQFHDHGRFRVRGHQQEDEAIDALVHPVVAESLQVYDAKYKFKPDSYLAVEVFPSTQAFGVRSVGLPHVAPHGICFGRVVTTRSPSEGNFNWRSVVWHEMAHVYHIQISQGRVPRWFTEGLAEYETNVKDAAWSRYHDRELYRGLVAGNLRGVLDLDKGFTQARSFEEILRSYHQASLVIHYLAETHGFSKLVEMLRAWGARKKHEEVYRTVLGKKPAEIDAGFQNWLHRRYHNFKGQLMVDLASVGAEADEVREAKKKGKDQAYAWARVAVARKRDGDANGSDSAMQKALALGENDLRVRNVAMLMEYAQGKIRDGYVHGNAILDGGRDSYDLRVVMGEAALQLEKPEEARIHFRAATQLWPNGIEAWMALYRLAGNSKDVTLQNQALARVFDLEQGDPVVARQFGARAVEIGDSAAALAAGERWVDIAPFDGRSHEMIARAALMRKDDARALQAWELWLSVRKNDTSDIYTKAIELSVEMNRPKLARELEKRALAAGVSERRIKRALGTR